MNSEILLAAQAQGSSDYSMIIVMVAIFVIMYFFMIRPQQKKQKEINNFRNSLTVGQAVVTIGGLHGTIKSMDDNKVVLHVSNGIDLTFEKAAINPTGTTPAQA